MYPPPQVFKYTQKGYTLLQNLTKAQSNDWVESSIPLANTGAFKIEFEGIRGSEYKGDIALDDIEVKFVELYYKYCFVYNKKCMNSKSFSPLFITNYW